MVDIQVDADPTEAEPVNLGTSSYQFNFPKVSPLISALEKAQKIVDKDERGSMILAAQNRWLLLGFGSEQWNHIQARLDSEADPLDFKHILEMFKQLFEKAAGNRPPTWRGDSSEVSPQAFQRAVGQSPFVSMPEPSLSPVSATS